MREDPPRPMNKPCPECWLNRDDALVLLNKNDWVSLMDVVIDEGAKVTDEETEARLKRIYEEVVSQLLQPANETVATIMREKKSNARQKGGRNNVL